MAQTTILAPKQPTMRALWINTKVRRVEEVDLPELSANLRQIVLEMLGCTGFIFTPTTDKNCQLIVDPDMLVNEQNFAVSIICVPRPLFGNMLVTGMEPGTLAMEGLCATIREEDLEARFYSRDETHLLRAQALDYARSLHPTTGSLTDRYRRL